jgi:hypothetical protein
MKAHPKLLAAAATVAAFAAAAPSAYATAGVTGSAAGSVTGTVVPDQLSVTAAVDTPLSPLSHAAPALASTTLSVVSTNTGWNLTMADTSAQNKGYLKKCTLDAGSGSFVPDTSAPKLSSGMKFATSLPSNLSDASQYTTLGSGTQTITSNGSLVGAATVWWFQPALGATDAVAAGDTYCTQITYTVTSTA